MAVLAVLSSVLTTGCISEKYDMPNNLQSVMVKLDVSAEQMTKTIQEDPTAVEKAINSLRIYAYQGERLAGYFHRDHSSDQSIFIDLQMPESGFYNVEFYVIANEKSMNLRSDSPVLSDQMTKSQLEKIAFQSLNNMNVNGIPMYGTATVGIDVTNIKKDADGNPVSNTGAGHEGHIMLDYNVDIDLSRPLAKLSFMAAKAPGGTLMIEEVKMLAKGTRLYGYLLPPSRENLAAVPPRSNDRILASNSTVNSELASHSTDPADYDNLTSSGVYLAEVPVGSTNWSTPVASDVNSAVLEITFSSGPSTPVRKGYVYMPPIERNKHYKVLCLFNSEGNIMINYIVEDWTEANMWTGGLTFDYPTHSYLWPDLSTTASSTPAEMTTSSPFVGYFKLEGPEHETFNPTILDGLASDYKVEVYDGTTLLTNSDDYVAADKWYTIKVFPLKAENAGTAIRLAITYQASWSTEAEFLMINGNSPNFVWPYNGTVFTQESEYVIITQQ